MEVFGSGTWGQHTFFNPVGPIAVMDQPSEDQPAALEKLYQLRRLDERSNTVIRAATPSLENNQSQGSASSVEGYFDQTRDALEQLCKLRSQLSRDRPQLRFLGNGIVQAKTQGGQVEASMPKMPAVLPSVKLPESSTWMSRAESAGSDGTIQVTVMETGSGVPVRKTWTDGDGSMTGTVIVTMIPYTDIGKIDFEPPAVKRGDTWTVRVQSATVPFPQTIDSPDRKTATRSLPAVHDPTKDTSVYFVFAH